VITTDEIVLFSARRKYEHQHLEHGKTKTIVSFDRMLELFGNDCLGFAEIARELEVSTERVRQIYERYFTSVFPGRPDGRARQEFCALKTNAVRKRDFSSGVPQLLTRIAEIAQTYGYVCNKIPIQFSGNRISFFGKSSLIINGKVCGIHYLTNEFVPHKVYKNRYSRLSLWRTPVEKYDFVIIFRQTDTEEHWFVIPTAVLLNGWNITKREKMFYIRDKNVPTCLRRHLDIELWDYADAWHLLAQE